VAGALSMYADRADAGRKLAAELVKLELQEPVVLALPRGGVPVAAEVAKALHARLDVVIVRKVGAPDNAELAVAAIVDGDPPDVVLNREIVEAYGLDDAAIALLVKRERPELERRRAVYRSEVRAVPVTDRTAILVDDGAATGTTMNVAVRALKRRAPREIIVAVPVAPPDTVAALEQVADRVICPSRPGRFLALGYHYLKFPQLSDDEVIAVLRDARERHRAESAVARKKAPKRKE
jgi:putative phosphoribosyl transferase